MSVQERVGKTGVRYVAVVDAPRDASTGKRKQLKRAFKTRREAVQWERETLTSMDKGEFVIPSKSSTADYLSLWLKAIQPSVRPSSHRRFREVIENHAIPRIGGLQLSKVNPAHIQAFEADLLRSGLSPSTVALDHNVVHRAFEQAVLWRLIVRNPCDGVEPPRPASPEMRTWSPEQARRFVTGTIGHSLEALWLLALTTGMRKGELLAIRWEDVDFERGTLAVRRTLTRGEDGFVFGEPKTKAGKRAIALPASCVKSLREHRRKQLAARMHLGPEWIDTDLVFERGNGELLHPNVAVRQFQRLATSLGLPSIRFHDMRHTAATLMLGDGVHPKIVQERLGHSDISMTLNRYSHVTMDMQREAAERMGSILGVANA